MRVPAPLAALVTVVLLTTALPGPSLTAGETPSPFPTGRLVEGVATLADPEITYTLYLPPGYDGETPRPALLIFDPRGRSVQAAELFLAGAERFGWIVVSSDDTRSDGPWEPNVRAVNALMPELDERFAVDPRRVYAAGFSGGAHLAWILGLRSGALAGVIASGGRDSPTWMVDEVPFAAFNAVGSEDFNYAGTVAVDQHFASRGTRHRMEIFPGLHGWMPPEMAFDAIAWLEVVAMAEGRRPLDPELVAERFRAELAAARALAAGDGQELLRAARRYDALLRTYGELAELEPVAAAGVDPAPARREVAALRQRRAFRAAGKEARRWDGYERTFQRRLGTVLLRLEDVEQPMTSARILSELDVPRLLKQAEEAGYAGTTARRLLATVYVQTAFYLSRDYLAAGRHRSAATVLEVATRIRPDSVTPWYNLACARALMGRKEPALEALQHAVDAGYADLDHLESDPDLESLRGEEGYRRLVRRLEEP